MKRLEAAREALRSVHETPIKDAVVICSKNHMKAADEMQAVVNHRLGAERRTARDERRRALERAKAQIHAVIGEQKRLDALREERRLNARLNALHA